MKEDASLLDLRTTHRPHAELVDTAPGSTGPEAHRRFRTASPAASPDGRPLAMVFGVRLSARGYARSPLYRWWQLGKYQFEATPR
jgi:hypothetical protein